MKHLTDTFLLNNGYAIPCIGYGTYRATNEIVSDAVKNALETGYRHIDTAAFYGNEPGIGTAISVKECGIPRDQLFITSKVWNTDRGYQTTLDAFDQTLQRLGLDYLDLYLIHWPANKKQFGEKAAEINAETWAALETLYKNGKVKAIGLSNFLPHHIEDLMKTASVRPMVDQIEYHPGWSACNNPSIIFMVVVFPAPFCPIKPKTECSGTEKQRSRRMVFFPKDFDT